MTGTTLVPIAELDESGKRLTAQAPAELPLSAHYSAESLCSAERYPPEGLAVTFDVAGGGRALSAVTKDGRCVEGVGNVSRNEVLLRTLTTTLTF